MKLIIVRPGEPDTKTEKTLGDTNDEGLSKLGMSQARLLADFLKDIKIDAIFSAPTGRYYLTANFVMKYHEELSIKKGLRLRERNFGKLIGTSINEVDWNKVDNDLVYIKQNKIEPLEFVKSRIEDFYEYLLKSYSKKCVLVIAHSNPIRALYSILLKKPMDDMFKIKLEDGAISIFEIHDKEIKCVRFNDTDYKM